RATALQRLTAPCKILTRGSTEGQLAFGDCGRVQLAPARTRVAVGLIAVVALFTIVGDAIAAHGQDAPVAAAIVVAVVAVIGRLAGGDDAVPAGGDFAIVVTAVAVDGVTAVALLRGIDTTIAAPDRPAICIAAGSAVAHLAWVDHMVAAGR